MSEYIARNRFSPETEACLQPKHLFHTPNPPSKMGIPRTCSISHVAGHGSLFLSQRPQGACPSGVAPPPQWGSLVLLSQLNDPLSHECEQCNGAGGEMDFVTEVQCAIGHTPGHGTQYPGILWSGHPLPCLWYTITRNVKVHLPCLRSS